MKGLVRGLIVSVVLLGDLAIAPETMLAQTNQAQNRNQGQGCPTCKNQENAPRIFGARFYDLWGIPIWPMPIHPHPGPAGGRTGEPVGAPPAGTPRGGGLLGGPLAPQTGGTDLPPAPGGEGGGLPPQEPPRRPRKECCCVKCDNLRRDERGWYNYDTVNLSIAADQDCSAWCRANGFTLGYEGRCKESVTQQEIDAYRRR